MAKSPKLEQEYTTGVGENEARCPMNGKYQTMVQK